MTAIIDALEARALVRRERHAVDRRFISVYLTDAGRVLLAEAAPVRTDAVVALMRELSGEQRTRLTRLCRRLLRVVDPTAEDGSDEDADDAEPQGGREEGAGDAAAGVLSPESADADAAHADVSNP
jgi:MarR family 2-MHQ and catechol resistance regulon transcriptional repressor